MKSNQFLSSRLKFHLFINIYAYSRLQSSGSPDKLTEYLGKPMPNETTDPRIFFAAERTLLAWLRTGLTIIGLGFVISRFGLFIQLLGLQIQPPIPHANSSISAILGICFVLMGSVSIAFAAVQHKRFIASLNFDQLPAIYSNKLAFALTIFVSILGFALAGYLWIA